MVVTRQAHGRGPGSPSRTHQQHGLLVDEGLLKSQRGSVQAWDWGAKLEGMGPRRGSQAWETGGKQKLPTTPPQSLTLPRPWLPPL